MHSGLLVNDEHCQGHLCYLDDAHSHHDLPLAFDEAAIWTHEELGYLRKEQHKEYEQPGAHEEW